MGGIFFCVRLARRELEFRRAALPLAVPFCCGSGTAFYCTAKEGQKRRRSRPGGRGQGSVRNQFRVVFVRLDQRSEEHTSELQSHSDLVCRLLLEKKKNNQKQ